MFDIYLITAILLLIAITSVFLFLLTEIISYDRGTLSVRVNDKLDRDILDYSNQKS